MHAIQGRGVPYNLTQRYDALLNALDDTATDANCGLVKSYGVFKRDIQDDSLVTLESFVYLVDWMARCSSDKENVHILIHAQETLRDLDGNYTMERSTVRVSYFQIENEGAALLHTVHYDHGPEQVAHPIFHAQLTNEAVSLTPEIAQELEFSVGAVPTPKLFKNARIPTSDMTLPSVVLCLAADHIRSDFFAGFLKRVISLQDEMPKPNLGKTVESMKANPHHLRSSHWFAHTFP